MARDKAGFGMLRKYHWGMVSPWVPKRLFGIWVAVRIYSQEGWKTSVPSGTEDSNPGLRPRTEQLLSGGLWKVQGRLEKCPEHLQCECTQGWQGLPFPGQGSSLGLQGLVCITSSLRAR